MKIFTLIFWLILSIFNPFPHNITKVNNYNIYNKENIDYSLTEKERIIIISFFNFVSSHIKLNDDTNVKINNIVDWILNENDQLISNRDNLKVSIIGLNFGVSTYSRYNRSEFFAELFSHYIGQISNNSPTLATKLLDDFFWIKLPVIANMIKVGKTEEEIFQYSKKIEVNDYVIEEKKINSSYFNSFFYSNKKYIYEQNESDVQDYYKLTYKYAFDYAKPKNVSTNELRNLWKNMTIIEDIMHNPYLGKDLNYDSDTLKHWNNFKEMNKEFEYNTKFENSNLSGLMLEKSINSYIYKSNHFNKNGDYINDEEINNYKNIIMNVMNIHYNIHKVEFYKHVPIIYFYSEYNEDLQAAGIYVNGNKSRIEINWFEDVRNIAGLQDRNTITYFLSTLIHEIGHSIDFLAMKSSESLDNMQNTSNVEYLNKNHYSNYSNYKLHVYNETFDFIEDQNLKNDTFKIYDYINVYMKNNSSVFDVNQKIREKLELENKYITDLDIYNGEEYYKKFSRYGRIETIDGDDLNFNQKYYQKLKNNETFDLYFKDYSYKNAIKIIINFRDELPEYKTDISIFSRRFEFEKNSSIEQKFKLVNSTIETNFLYIERDINFANLEFYLSYPGKKEKWTIQAFEQIYNSNINISNELEIIVTASYPSTSKFDGYVILKQTFLMENNDWTSGESGTTIGTSNGIDWGLIALVILVPVSIIVVVIIVIVIFKKRKLKR